MYYLVFDDEYEFKGYTGEKELIDWFKAQRNMDYFRIEKLDNEYEANANLVKTIQNTYKELIPVHGYALFMEEEEYMSSSFDQMLMDVYSVLERMIERIKYVRLEDDERKIVDQFLFQVFSQIQEHQEAFEEDSEENPFLVEKYFHVDKLVTKIIKSFER